MSSRLFGEIDTRFSETSPFSFGGSVEVIQGKDRRSFPYTMEPEFAVASLPRLIYREPKAVIFRRLLWNTWAVVLIMTILLVRQQVEILPVIMLIVAVSLTVQLGIRERRWWRESHLLRKGIAIGGWVSSGTVISARGANHYRIYYCFHDGKKVREEEIGVTSEQFNQLIYSNPNNTVLYDAEKPGNSMLYIQVQSTRLSVIR